MTRDWDREYEIVAFYMSGLTMQEIGSSYGITRERVRQILKRNNVVSRPARRRHVG